MNRHTYADAYRREQRAYYLTGLAVVILGGVAIIVTLWMGAA
jgi:hypothetical protein